MESAFVWDEDRIAILTKMLAESCSARMIAGRLGTTRNAVLGKSNRLGLSAPKLVKVPPRKPRKPRKSNAGIVGSSRNVNILCVVGRFERAELRCAEIDPRNVSLLALKDNDCRAPYGSGLEATFCGHPKMAGSSYCPKHRALFSERPKTPIHKLARVAA